jgi:hypothetical protein
MPIGFRNSGFTLGAVSAAMIAFDVAALRPFVDARLGSTPGVDFIAATAGRTVIYRGAGNWNVAPQFLQRASLHPGDLYDSSVVSIQGKR